MAEISFPFNGTDTSFQDRWRQMFGHLGDGVIDDYSGGGLRVTADGSSTTVTAAAGLYRIQSHILHLTAAKALTLGSIGSQPIAGQTRIDKIVVRLHTTAAPEEEETGTKVTVQALPGNPVASGAVPPTPTRNLTTWEREIAQVTRTGTAAVTQGSIADWRTWMAGPSLVVAGGAVLPAGPVGMVARQGQVTWRRVLDANLSPVWVADQQVAVTGGLTGAYTPNTATRRIEKIMTVTTDSAGDATLIAAAETPGGGVISCHVTGATFLTNVNVGIRVAGGEVIGRVWVNNVAAPNGVFTLSVSATVF